MAQIAWMDQREWGINFAVNALRGADPPHPLLLMAEAALAELVPHHPHPPLSTPSIPDHTGGGAGAGAGNWAGLEKVDKPAWQIPFKVCGGAATVGFDAAGALSLLITTSANLSYAAPDHLLGETVVHISSPAQRSDWARKRWCADVSIYLLSRHCACVCRGGGGYSLSSSLSFSLSDQREHA
jgi:hypothetical protein